MEHHETWFTHLLNSLFAPWVTAALEAVGIHPHNPLNPIPEHVAMGIFLFLVMVPLVLLLKRRLSVDRPGAAQQICELLLTNKLGFGIRDLLDENVAHHEGRKFVAMTGSVAIFILLANLLGVIPAFTSPTANATVPLGCAIITFLYFNWQGVRKFGPFGYLKNLSGPVWWMAILLLPVEIISITARVLSLTVRLWANIFASELIYLVFLGILVVPVHKLSEVHFSLAILAGIFPALIPLAFVGLHIFVAVIQSFVFTILPSIYLGLAVAEEH